MRFPMTSAMAVWFSWSSPSSCLRRQPVPRLLGGIFPDSPTPADDLGSLFPGTDEAVDTTAQTQVAMPTLDENSLVGFWTIFDEQATEDTLNSMTSGGATKPSLFSAPLVLRADGRTSRGSDFPGGTWEVTEQIGTDGGARKRLSIVLQSKLLKQEWRYEGLVFALQMALEPSLDDDAAASAARPSLSPPPPPPSMSPSLPALEIRVVGQSCRWELSPESEPKPMGKPASFSMIKKDVDRRKLTPTIKPLSQPVDPEEVRRESEWRRLVERSEEDEIRRAIEDVQKMKEEHGDGWRDADQLQEGRDFWKLGQEPSAAPGVKPPGERAAGREQAEPEGDSASRGED